MPRPTVEPRPIGTYPSLIGVPLRADVSLPKGEELAGYEIELVEGRKSGRSKAWSKPRWAMTTATVLVRRDPRPMPELSDLQPPRRQAFHEG